MNAEQANDIFRQWMDLPFDAPEPTRQRVCKLVESLPRNYFSVADDGYAVAIMRGQPLNNRMPLAECVKFYPKIPTDLVWFSDRACYGPMPKAYQG